MKLNMNCKFKSQVTLISIFLFLNTNLYSKKKEIGFIGVFSDSSYNVSEESFLINSSLYKCFSKNKRVKNVSQEINYCQLKNLIETNPNNSNYRYYLLGIFSKKNKKELLKYYIIANNYKLKGKAFQLESFEEIYQFKIDDRNFNIALNKRIKKLKIELKKIRKIEFTRSEYHNVINFLSRFEKFKCKEVLIVEKNILKYKADSYFERLVLEIKGKLESERLQIEVGDKFKLIKESNYLYNTESPEWVPNFYSLFNENSKNWHFSGQLIKAYVFLLKVEGRINRNDKQSILDDQDLKDLIDCQKYLTNIQNNDTLDFLYTDFEKKTWNKFDIDLNDFYTLVKRKLIVVSDFTKQLNQLKYYIDNSYFEKAISLLDNLKNSNYFKKQVDSLYNVVTSNYLKYIETIQKQFNANFEVNDLEKNKELLDVFIKNPFIRYKIDNKLLGKIEKLEEKKRTDKVIRAFTEYWNASLKFNYLDIAEYSFKILNFDDSLRILITYDSNYNINTLNSNNILFQSFGLSQYKNDNINFVCQMLNSFLINMNEIDSNFHFSTTISIKGLADATPYNRRFSSFKTNFSTYLYSSCGVNDFDDITLNDLAYGRISSSYSKNCVLAYLRAVNISEQINAPNCTKIVCGYQENKISPEFRSVKLEILIKLY